MAEATVKSEADFLSRKQAAAYLTRLGCAISHLTLARLAQNNNEGRGPPFLRFRWKTVRYERADLDNWAKKQSTRIE